MDLIIIDDETEETDELLPLGINTLNPDGTAVLDGQTVAVQGIVHCIDFRDGDGLQFWIIEPNGDGINIFSFGDVSDYQVAEGDEIRVVGEVDQFRGLLEVIPTAIEVVSTENDLVSPTVVDMLEESLESKYVSLNIDMAIEDGLVRAGEGFNVSVVQRGNQDTIVIRVEDETGVDSTFLANYFYGDRVPESSLIVTGLVSQRDFSAPFDDFYQLFPCGEGSFDLVTSTRTPDWAQEIQVYPNPTSGILELRLPTAVDQYRLTDLHGRLLQQGAPAPTLDLTSLPSGLYQLQFIGSGGAFVSRKVVKW